MEKTLSDDEYDPIRDNPNSPKNYPQKDLNRTLSDEIRLVFDDDNDNCRDTDERLKVEDVKKFIKRLKEESKLLSARNNVELKQMFF
ncbi:MAG: hypothetical protein AABW67_04160 [Nanoarchaeota archaeon]